MTARATRLWWKACAEMTEPRQVEGPAAGWPALDAEGDRIYENTHYEIEAEAWEHLRSERLAHVSNTGTRVKGLRTALVDAEKRAATAAILLSDFWTAYAARRDRVVGHEADLQGGG